MTWVTPASKFAPLGMMLVVDAGICVVSVVVSDQLIDRRERYLQAADTRRISGQIRV